ncbi:MAG: TonB-dependent receptor [Bacteroidota bacterium]
MKKKQLVAKILTAMRITIIQLALATALSSSLYAGTLSAQELLDKPVTISVDNLAIRKVIGKLQKQTGIEFIYSTSVIEAERKISCNSTDMKLGQFLQEFLNPVGIGYKIIEKQILLIPLNKAVTNPAAESMRVTENTEQALVQTVSGTVTNNKKEPLAGVSITIKGTTTGTMTNENGYFKLIVPGPGSVLIISYTGFANQEIEVGNKSSLQIGLTALDAKMDEVIVVGYGTQKKVNLTGSVSAISGNELVKRPVTNVANLLQGKVSGLQVVQNSGEPGNDNPVLRIRGLGTFSSAGSDPLVLVNGVQGTLSGLSPDDIETVSVLKDAASAAIYGARAANGVILVTTKQGKSGALNLEYSGNYQVQQPTRMPKFVTNSADFMTDWNLANERANDVHYFSDAEINAFRTSTDKVKYPNFNWIDYMLHNGTEQNHHLSMNGGSDKTSFNFSVGYLDQDGLNKAFNFKRYNMMLNMTSKLNSVVTFGTNITSNYQDRVEPVMGSNEFMLLVYTAGPNYLPKLSDGSGRWTWRYNNAAWHNRNPEQALTYGNIRHKVYSVAAQSYIDLKLTKDLVFEVKGAVNYDDNFDKSNEHNVASYFYSDNSLAALATGYNVGVSDNDSRNILTTLYSTLNYTKTFASKHNLRVLAGYSQEANNYRYLQGHKTTFPSTTLGEINAGSSNGQYVNGNSQDWAIRSYFGRLNYDFEGKYLLEVNSRYDGSSRIAEDHRWGLFPSVSAGWRLSKEKFMQKYSWLDELKVRGSWGKLGNQNIGLYPYQDILSINSYAFSSDVSQGASVTRLTDKNIKWETTGVTDFGVDFSMKNGLFSITADWYNKVTNDILYGINIPASIGLASPTVNYAKMKNTGFEFEAGHKNTIGALTYSVSVNFSTYKNTVVRVNTPTYGTTTIQEGLPWNSYYLTEWTGIFQSQEEIDKSPKQPYNPKPGDLKFKDQNGDGVIDAKDRVVVGGAFPAYYYGGSINLSWKNFDLSSFFQGVQGQKFYVNGWGIDPFIQGNAPTIDFASKAWTPKNKSNTTPAMYRDGYGPVTGTASTYYLKDASYFRLKNLTIGYNFAKGIYKRLGMKSMRIYFSGDNLLTKTKYPGADPERTGSGRFQTYPQLRIFAAGVNVKF